VADILKRHPTIPARNIIAHQDIAPTRKTDPGIYFNWKSLHEKGFGLFHSVDEKQTPTFTYKIDTCSTKIPKLRKELSEFGYKVSDLVKECVDEELAFVFAAFNRHYH
jgi:N-acetyl-anhydromuramyl-L-alanine amidase AmpD